MSNRDRAAHLIMEAARESEVPTETAINAVEALADAGLLAPDLAQENLRMGEQVKGLILAMETKAANNEQQDPATIASYLKEIVLGDHVTRARRLVGEWEEA